MAEAAPAGGFDIRRLLLLGGVVLVVVFAVIFLFVRSCAPVVGGRGNGYTVIYTNLSLKDAANAVARLKELAIPYEIRDEGKAIAVQKDKTDQARLGLAEKNLPAGGVVGWEIFDESKLGATDFDRRIQLIRAISGELSRTIRRIEAVEDARVQIVMPETRLFETVKAPVTASVMLRLKPGAELTKDKIRGIVHLVASSVENLQIQNVTVVDDTGRILTAGLETQEPEKKLTALSESLPPTPQEKIIVTPSEIVITPEVEEAAAHGPLSAEEKMSLKVQAKRELENDLAGKAQEILNRFYPPNTVIVKLDIELKNSSDAGIMNYELRVKNMNAVILLDNRIELTPELKDATFKSVAAAIGYDRSRGDKIILQKVPFHLATPPPEVMRAEVEKVFPEAPAAEKKAAAIPLAGISYLPWIAGGVVLILLLIMVISRLGQKPRSQNIEEMEMPQAVERRPAERAPGKASEVDSIRRAAAGNPEKIAELLKSWLTE